MVELIASFRQRYSYIYKATLKNGPCLPLDREREMTNDRSAGTGFSTRWRQSPSQCEVDADIRLFLTNPKLFSTWPGCYIRGIPSAKKYM